MPERDPLPRPVSLAERRRFLKVLGAAAMAPLVGAGAAAAALPSGVAGAALGAVPGAVPTVVRGPGGVFLVNGWVLTGDDLDALGLRAA